MAGNRERSSLVPRGVEFDQVLKSVVIDVVCGTVVQLISCVIGMFQSVKHRMEHRHTVSPLWHGILLEGLSVLHAFTCDARACEVKRRGQEREFVVEVLAPNGPCTKVPYLPGTVSCGLRFGC
jgi:hypothetical protein